ncbi:stromal processing peptidase, chloroplastic [Rhodamnia argentea]|uniref:Stromal processing peptidase, chloroplastic n=1 Tax=Rhodamnia argentea TaxID=178133 RepID=A0A8B8PCX7_9MYRT|nr:stromal processing peptidase, chloroplastic [Rhodamnia argentea]XP_030532524.1 stromal processing peptidase, chloroplastic [Rhodamnia argentea]XP_030532603.1 stromal processing peptidase, chloroplastic [Rhodamnia argentea]XP_030532687.1 stromal processing peptidase, chloroplastic [Rhodamnia argentea]XP_030532776.1 stromal processing peptidase, chloroplastic [Rhodamnia argentea]XP_030532848.1 stromal processing peptidase, chloroplastic [Rhodamnia argentea]XP_030532929.1 stromal processing p
MASSTSVVASLPRIRPSRDERFSVSGLPPSPSPSRLAASASLTRLNSRCQSIYASKRWPFGVVNRCSTYQRKNDTWRRRSSMFSRRLTDLHSTQLHNCIACSLSQRKGRLNSRRSIPRAFTDKSAFHSSKLSLNSASHVRVPCATVGPEEPHAASTTWPDGILEKQDLDLLNFESERTELEAFLSSKLPPHPKLYRGQLKNGLRYLILPNKVPLNRFEAHMEVHAGSIDEEGDEQGIAHMIEHVAFLGSKKREKLLGTGARSNAYTDFHHTVFHIHSPTSAKDSGEDLLPSVLDALNEIAFHPKFLSSRVEKERRAILSELQMMNTIEYRVDCQLLQHLHSENKLSQRFPIGLEEQIKKWDADKIRKFHERWYFPANATLYIVGDIDNISKTVSQIEAVFGQTALESETPPAPTPSAFGAMASFLVPKLPVGLSGSSSHDRPSTLDQAKVTKKERHAIRPPVEHNWSLPGNLTDMKAPQIFQHELLQNFSINMFCKIPVSKVQTYGDLRNVLMKRIFLSALHFRINTRYKSSNPPFTSVELDHSDSGREGCTVTTLTVTAEPKNWQSAIKVAVQEVRRLKEFGVTKGELTRYMDALLKDSEQLAAMIDNVSSVDNLDFIMESDALGHTVMDQRQGHESLVAVAGTVTLEEVNAVGAKVLEYIADFGKPTAPNPAAIVACVPKKVHIDGVGETEFRISPREIIDAMKTGLEQPIEPEPELEVPKELISSSQLQELKVQRMPSFVPLTPLAGIVKSHDKETGITQCRLSNGIRVNYKISQSESRGGVMRLIVGGGRAVESSDSRGAVIVGVRTLSEGGRVGNFSREQVELFCVNHLINCSLESTEEFISMEFRFTLRDNGMNGAFQLLHMVLEHSVWLDDAFDRARQLYLSYYRSIPKSLERSTAHKLMLAMLNGDERFVEPTPMSLQNLTLETVRDAVMDQFIGDNMEVSIVGDFSEEEIESCILNYLGTVRTTRGSGREKQFEPVLFRPSPTDLQSQQVFLKDTDERACAYIAGPAPNRWGFTVEGKDLFESITEISIGSDGQSHPEEESADKDVAKDMQRKLRNHPLFFGIAMGLLAEIINSRLFTTVRDSLGLTYDVSFELNLFDRLELGWYVISVTSTPAKVHKAVDACKNVLRGLHSNKIAQRELDRAKRTLLMRHEAEIKSNAYWLGLLAHLQASSVPRKDISCIKDLTSLYEAATIEDIFLAYDQLKIDESSLYSCVGIAGAQAGEEIIAPLEEGESEEEYPGVIPMGRGLSTMTRPTT